VSMLSCSRSLLGSDRPVFPVPWLASFAEVGCRQNSRQPQCQCGALVRSLPVTRLARPNFSPSSITRMSSSLSLLPTLLAAVIVGTDRRIVRRLRELNALSPEEATALPTWRLLSRWRARRLMGRGALVPVPPDRVYLNEEAWK